MRENVRITENKYIMKREELYRQYNNRFHFSLRYETASRNNTEISIFLIAVTAEKHPLLTFMSYTESILVTILSRTFDHNSKYPQVRSFLIHTPIHIPCYMHFLQTFKIVFSIWSSFTLMFKQNKHTKNQYFHRIWFNVNKIVP